jgi:heptosyltransferase-1
MSLPQPVLSNASPRILITRLSHIGDCVFTLPVLCALRRAFPQAHICWAVESPSHQLLDDHDALNETIRIPKGWVKSPATFSELRRQLKSYRFDFVIDPQSLTKSSALGWISGSKRRVGFAKPWGRELALILNNERIHPRSKHVALRSLELLKGLGIRQPQVEFRLPILESARSTMRSFLDDHQLTARYALINPGATWNSKQWGLERFAEVADSLSKKHGLPTLILWAGEQEQRAAETIADLASGQVMMAPPTSLQQLAALASTCRLFISGDTGPLHIAAATNAPCIGLYGATQPDHCGAYGEHCVNLQAAYQEGSAKQRRRANNDAMLAITPHMVTVAADQLLAKIRSARAA